MHAMQPDRVAVDNPVRKMSNENVALNTWSPFLCFNLFEKQKTQREITVLSPLLGSNAMGLSTKGRADVVSAGRQTYHGLRYFWNYCDLTPSVNRLALAFVVSLLETLLCVLPAVQAERRWPASTSRLARGQRGSCGRVRGGEYSQGKL